LLKNGEKYSFSCTPCFIVPALLFSATAAIRIPRLLKVLWQL